MRQLYLWPLSVNGQNCTGLTLHGKKKGESQLEHQSSSKDELNEYFTMPSLWVHVITAFPMMLD